MGQKVTQMIEEVVRKSFRYIYKTVLELKAFKIDILASKVDLGGQRLFHKICANLGKETACKIWFHQYVELC